MEQAPSPGARALSLPSPRLPVASTIPTWTSQALGSFRALQIPSVGCPQQPVSRGSALPKGSTAKKQTLGLMKLATHIPARP
eukprot:4400367-Alexandrium_andersonii.AAC.1